MGRLAFAAGFLALACCVTPATAGTPQPSAAALIAEAAFPVNPDAGQLTFGRASVTAAGLRIETDSGEAVQFRLAGVLLPVGRECLHPDRGSPVDCLDLTRATLAALVGGRRIGCQAPPGEAGECYLPHEGAWYSVNRLLVRSGMVRALAPRFIEAERASRRQGAGLWDPMVYPTGDGWREQGAHRVNGQGAAGAQGQSRR